MFDLRTLLITTFVESVFFGAIILFLSSRRKCYSGSREIGYGMFCAALSLILIACQGRLPSIISIVVLGVFCAATANYFNHGFREFLGIESNANNYIYGSFLTFIWFYYFSEIRGDYLMRVFWISTYLAVMMADNFKILFFQYIPGIKNLCRITGLIFLMLSIFFVVRVATMFEFFQTSKVRYMMEYVSPNHYYITLAVMGIVGIGLFLIFLCIIFMINFRLESELIESRQKLIEVNNDRDRFFSIIAHDLISPFSSIPRLVQLLLEKYDALPDEKIKEMMADIFNVSSQTYLLLENLLTWSRTATGRVPFNPEDTDIRDIVDDIIRLNGERIKTKTVKIVNSVPHEFKAFCDADMTRTIVRNLIGNAIKFTPADGVIKITGTAGDDEISFTVKDSGVGIKSETAAKLFKTGERVSNIGTNGESGTGIGLLIVKDFVDKHGGKITVETSEGGGSAFTVSFPVVNKVTA